MTLLAQLPGGVSDGGARLRLDAASSGTRSWRRPAARGRTAATSTPSAGTAASSTSAPTRAPAAPTDHDGAEGFGTRLGPRSCSPSTRTASRAACSRSTARGRAGRRERARERRQPDRGDPARAEDPARRLTARRPLRAEHEHDGRVLRSRRAAAPYAGRSSSATELQGNFWLIRADGERSSRPSSSPSTSDRRPQPRGRRVRPLEPQACARRSCRSSARSTSRSSSSP